MGTHASQTGNKIRLLGRCALQLYTMQRHNLFVITGGNRGFGLAIANALKANVESKHLTTIILVGRDSTTLEQAATSLIGLQLKCFCIGSAELDNVDTVDNVVLSEIRKLVEVCTRYGLLLQLSATNIACLPSSKSRPHLPLPMRILSTMLVPLGISPRKLQLTIRPRLSSTTMSISFLTCRWCLGSSNYSVNLLLPMRALFHLILRLSIFRHFWQFRHSLIGGCTLVARLPETCSLKSLLLRKRTITSKHCLMLPDLLIMRCKLKSVQHWETQTRRKFTIPWLMRYSIILLFQNYDGILVLKKRQFASRENS
jgi:hypothetical protein